MSTRRDFLRQAVSPLVLGLTAACQHEPVGPYLRLLAPVGGEQIPCLQPYRIRWQSGGLRNVQLAYSLNAGGAWIDLAQDVPAAAGAFLWAVPDTAATRTRLRIAGGDLVAESAANFEIQAIYVLPLTQYPALQTIGGHVVMRTLGLGDFTVVRTGADSCVARGHTCPHASCTVVLEGQTYVCPCHNSTFDFGGNVLSGPADKPLPLLTATFNGQQVVVSA